MNNAMWNFLQLYLVYLKPFENLRINYTIKLLKSESSLKSHIGFWFGFLPYFLIYFQFFLTAGLTTLLINGVETALNTSFDIISIDDNTDVAHNVSKGEIAFSLGSGSGLVIGYSDMLLQATLSYESDDVER